METLTALKATLLSPHVMSGHQHAIAHYVTANVAGIARTALCGANAPGSTAWTAIDGYVTCSHCRSAQRFSNSYVYQFGVHGRMDDKTHSGMWEAYDVRKPHIRLVVSLNDVKLHEKLDHFFGGI